jgi:radical SAM protein with 4Fe4S-binding SPASM domain
MDLFRKIVDECEAEGVFSLRLSWRGESLSHPRIQEIIADACAHVRNVSFLTNALYLNDEIIDCLIKNRVSYVSISFDGIGDTYEAVRAPAEFEESYSRVARLSRKRDEAGSMNPQVRACAIWPAIAKDPDGYYETMRKVTDYVVHNPYTNFKEVVAIKPGFICQYPWQRIVIAFDGMTQCCVGWNADSIILGNVREHSVKDMWHSAKMEEIRHFHAQSRRMEMEACADCRHGNVKEDNVSIEQILARGY